MGAKLNLMVLPKKQKSKKMSMVTKEKFDCIGILKYVKRFRLNRRRLFFCKYFIFLFDKYNFLIYNNYKIYIFYINIYFMYFKLFFRGYRYEKKNKKCE